MILFYFISITHIFSISFSRYAFKLCSDRRIGFTQSMIGDAQPTQDPLECGASEGPTTSISNPGLISSTPPESRHHLAREPTSSSPPDGVETQPLAASNKSGKGSPPKPKPRFSRARKESHDSDSAEAQDADERGALLVTSRRDRGDEATGASAFQRKGVRATIAVFEQRKSSPSDAPLASPTKPSRSQQPNNELSSPPVGATPSSVNAVSSEIATSPTARDSPAVSTERPSRVPPPVDHSKKPMLDLSRFTKRTSMPPPPSQPSSSTSTSKPSTTSSSSNSSALSPFKRFLSMRLTSGAKHTFCRENWQHFDEPSGSTSITPCASPPGVDNRAAGAQHVSEFNFSAGPDAGTCFLSNDPTYCTIGEFDAPLVASPVTSPKPVPLPSTQPLIPSPAPAPTPLVPLLSTPALETQTSPSEDEHLYSSAIKLTGTSSIQRPAPAAPVVSAPPARPPPPKVLPVAEQQSTSSSSSWDTYASADEAGAHQNLNTIAEQDEEVSAAAEPGATNGSFSFAVNFSPERNTTGAQMEKSSLRRQESGDSGSDPFSHAPLPISLAAKKKNKKTKASKSGGSNDADDTSDSARLAAPDDAAFSGSGSNRHNPFAIFYRSQRVTKREKNDTAEAGADHKPSRVASIGPPRDVNEELTQKLAARQSLLNAAH